MLLDIGLVLAGLVALFAGGEWLVRGAVALAARLGLPTLLISLTVVGFGTSMPELLVSVRAAFAGQGDIALGNVVGSNTANVLLIIGMAALISPMLHWDRAVKRDAAVMVLVAIAALFLVQFDVIGIGAGLAMVAVLAAYLTYAYFADRDGGAASETLPVATTGPAATAGLLAAGLVLLFVGAESLVRGATAIARDVGISEAVIGLTIVAVGTSLPELATSLVAAIKRNSDIAIGNVVGSNIFNILAILGITAIIAPVEVSSNFAAFDVPVMLGVCLLFGALLWWGRRIGRVTGGLFLAAYVAYTAYLFAA